MKNPKRERWNKLFRLENTLIEDLFQPRIGDNVGAGSEPSFSNNQNHLSKAINNANLRGKKCGR